MTELTSTERLTTGAQVPDFTADSTLGPWRLSEQLKRWLVLYFYPRDDTPGCTTESEEFRDAEPLFAQWGATIVGISRDTLKSHARFKEKYALPFVLLSDPQETLCLQFGVMKAKTMYGKPVRGIERSTFLIDHERRIVHEWRGVKVPQHVAEVLKQLQTLSTNQ